MAFAFSPSPLLLFCQAIATCLFIGLVGGREKPERNRKPVRTLVQTGVPEVAVCGTAWQYFPTLLRSFYSRRIPALGPAFRFWGRKEISPLPWECIPIGSGV